MSTLLEAAKEKFVMEEQFVRDRLFPLFREDRLTSRHILAAFEEFRLTNENSGVNFNIMTVLTVLQMAHPELLVSGLNQPPSEIAAVHEALYAIAFGPEDSNKPLI